MKRIVIGTFTAVVLFILFIVLCTFVRRPYEEVLIYRFGNLITEKQQARLMYNWYFKLPTDSIVRIDKRLHLKTLSLKEFVTASTIPVSVRAFAVWRIVDPVAFRQKASGSDEVAEQIMEQRILGLIGQDLGKHKLDEFFNTTPETEKKVRDMETQIAMEATRGSADKKIPGLNELGIEIADIGFSRMAFPPSNTAEIYNRMVADLNQKARDIESKGIAEADKTRAEGSRQSEEIRRKAIADAEEIRGKGDREAGEIIAKVSENETTREFYQYWKSLEFLKVSLAKNTVLVLSSDNLLLKPLFEAFQPPSTQPAAEGAAGKSPVMSAAANSTSATRPMGN